jgi:predicted nucleic acid-binding protein
MTTLPYNGTDFLNKIQLLLQAYDKNLISENVLKDLADKLAVERVDTLSISEVNRVQLLYQLYDKNLISDEKMKAVVAKISNDVTNFMKETDNTVK